MPIFGCHSCGIDISKYPSYLESPCATCKLAKEYYNTPKAPFYDCSESRDSGDDKDAGHGRSYVNPYDIEAPDDDGQPGYDDMDLDSATDSAGMKALKEAVEQKMILLLSGITMKLVRMAKNNPVMFEVVIKKMQFPYMSYSEIGASMTPSITKQNVLYHLKHAIEVFPEIASVFITDTRFSAGKNALETVAKKERRHEAVEKVKGILYGDDERQKAMAMRELNSILKAPFLVSDSILDYNYYSNDEITLRQEREREKNRERIENELKG